MSWVRIDDGFTRHPKVMAAGPLAIAMQVAALCYCNRELTDGFVPRGIARTLLDWEFERGDGKRFKVEMTATDVTPHVTALVTCDTIVDILVESGMWIVVRGGYRIHDYEKYQATKASVLAEREATMKRQAAWRSKKSTSNANSNAVSHGVSHGVTNGSRNAVSHGVSHASRNGPVTVLPTPYPSSINSPSESKRRVARNGPSNAVTQKATAKPSEPEGYKPVIEAYFAAYERAKGAKPVFRPRTGKAAKALLGAMSQAEAIALIDRAFADTWFVANQGELWHIADSPNRFRGTSARPFPVSASRLIVQPMGGDWRENMPKAESGT